MFVLSSVKLWGREAGTSGECVGREEHRTFSPGASEAKEGAHSPAGLGFSPLLLSGEGMQS